MITVPQTRCKFLQLSRCCPVQLCEYSLRKKKLKERILCIITSCFYFLEVLRNECCCHSAASNEYTAAGIILQRGSQANRRPYWMVRQQTYLLPGAGWYNQAFMAQPTIKWGLFQGGILFSVCHRKTLNMAILQLRQIQSRAIVLGCCRELAPLSWKLSSGSSDRAPAVQIPLGDEGWRQVGAAQRSWILYSWRQRAAAHAAYCSPLPINCRAWAGLVKMCLCLRLGAGCPDVLPPSPGGAALATMRFSSSGFVPPTNEVSLSFLLVLPGVFFYLSSAVNPIIYNLLSQRFRLAFLSVISPRCRHWAPKHPTSQIPAQQNIFVVEDHNLADSAEDTSVPGTHRTSVSSSQLSTGLWLVVLWSTWEGNWRKLLWEITRRDSPKRPISERRAHRLCLKEWMSE